DAANAHVSGLVDELGHRSTLLWDGGGNRVGAIDSLNQRSTYLYAAGTEQIAASIDPLNARNTILYDSVGQTKARLDGTSARTSYAYLNGQTLRVGSNDGSSLPATWRAMRSHLRKRSSTFSAYDGS